jgi:hypothetical protein
MLLAQTTAGCFAEHCLCWTPCGATQVQQTQMTVVHMASFAVTQKLSA